MGDTAQHLLVSDAWLPGRLIDGIAAQILSVSNGEETGGLLFGPCPASGHLFRLDGFQAVNLDKARPSASEVAGIYRSHKRPGLQTTDEDAARVKILFANRPALLLLVKPLSGSELVAAFYRCENGEILEPGTSSREFPFHLPEPAEGLVPPVNTPPGSGRSAWFVPSAIAAGLAAAMIMHYVIPKTSDDDPVSVHTINSYSDTLQAEPFRSSGASSSPANPASARPAAGKLWHHHSAKPEQRIR